MFDKFKQINKLRKLQAEIGQEKFSEEQEGIKVIINGNLQVEEIVLNPELGDNQGQVLKNCLNNAFKKAQMAVAQKMSQMM